MRKMTALALTLVLIAAVDQAAGQTEAGAAPVRSGQYGEAPMLAALVASRRVAPVEERLPETPRVLEVEPRSAPTAGRCSRSATWMRPTGWPGS